MAHNEGPRQKAPNEIFNAVYNTNTSALNVALASDAITISAINTSPDAGLFRVSGIGAGFLSANQSVSAVLLAGTANIGYVSAFVDNGSISAKQGDAGQFRTSAFFVSLDTTNNVEKVEQQMNYFYLSTFGLFNIKNSSGLLHSITVNKKGTATTLNVYDTSATSVISPQVAALDTTLSQDTLIYDVKLINGLTVSAVSGTLQADITLSYR